MHFGHSFIQQMNWNGLKMQTFENQFQTASIWHRFISKTT